jgi:hypothetical protein
VFSQKRWTASGTAGQWIATARLFLFKRLFPLENYILPKKITLNMPNINGKAQQDRTFDAIVVGRDAAMTLTGFGYL